jgi:hypothetical protein
MSIIPSCEQFSVAIERTARTIAIGLAWVILATQITYEAGLWTGTQVHRLNDWLARASHAPVTEAAKAAEAAIVWADKVTAAAPAPTFAAILEAEGIRPLTPAELEAEIARFDAHQDAKPTTRKRPAARRKPAKARRAKAVAA